jgi:hypothetical protein
LIQLPNCSVTLDKTFVQLALLALHICREQHVVRLQLSQSSDISAVGCPNNMGEHVNASEDPRDNILGRRRMRKGRPICAGNVTLFT